MRWSTHDEPAAELRAPEVDGRLDGGRLALLPELVNL